MNGPGGRQFVRMEGEPGKMVPIIGIELMTYRLQGGCSTN